MNLHKKHTICEDQRYVNYMMIMIMTAITVVMMTYSNDYCNVITAMQLLVSIIQNY